MAISEGQIHAIYKRAADKYQEIAKEPLEVNFVRKLQTVEDLTNEIDEHNNSFEEFRNKRALLFDVLKGALIPVQLFGALAAGGAEMVFAPSSLVFASVTYLMDAAKGVSASYDSIQELLARLKEFTIRLNVYAQEKMSDALGEKLSNILVTLIEVFALSTKAIHRGRLGKFIRNVALGNDDPISAAVEKLEKLTQFEASLVGAETLTEAKKSSRIITNVAATLTDMQEALQFDRTHQQRKYISEALKISKSDQQSVYEKINKARLAGTGDWVRSEPIFNNWLKKDFPVIYISGNPGAGKSYLSTNIISLLQEQYPQDIKSHISIVYFFFKDNNPDTRSAHQALRDMAYQISLNDSIYQNYLVSIENFGRIGTLESAWKLLYLDFFHKSPHHDSCVYILLDGVDEAFDDGRRAFLECAKDLYENPGMKRIQIALVGRPHLRDQLRQNLELDDVPTIHVGPEKNSADIDDYIKASVRKSVILRKVSVKVRQEVIETLSARAEGMFLWVNLMIQELEKLRSEASMRKSLKEAPKGLKEMMRHVLSSYSENFPAEELEYLNEILIWTACATKQLNLCFIEDLLKLKTTERDGMINLEGALRNQFASFFNLDREDGLTTADLYSLSVNQKILEESDDELDEKPGENEEGLEDSESLKGFKSGNSTEVTFCHASIGDFFRDEREGKLSAGPNLIAVGVNWREAKVHVFKTCLRLFTDPKLREERRSIFWIMFYAAANLFGQLLSTPSSYATWDDRLEIASMLAKLMTDEEAMELWLEQRIEIWSATKQSLEAIQQWWKDEDILNALPSQERDFVRSTQEDPSATFKPLAIFCLKVSMREWVVGPDRYVRAVWSYQRFLEDQEVDLATTSLNPAAGEIVKMSNLVDAEKNADWYRSLAKLFAEFNYHKEAQQYLENAREADPENIGTLSELSKVHMKFNDWAKAVEIDKECERLLNDPDKLGKWEMRKWEMHNCLERMSVSYQNMNEIGKCLSMSKRALECHTDCDACFEMTLSLQHKNHQHEENIALLHMLAETKHFAFKYSSLAWFIMRADNRLFFQYIAGSALATKNLPFMIDCWRNAAKVALDENETVEVAQIDLGLARIYYEYTRDELKAIRKWEKVLNMFPSAKGARRSDFMKLEASRMLATHFLSKAVVAGVGTPQAEEQIDNLKNLINRVNPTTSSPWLVSSASSRCLLPL